MDFDVLEGLKQVGQNVYGSTLGAVQTRVETQINKVIGGGGGSGQRTESNVAVPSLNEVLNGAQGVALNSKSVFGVPIAIAAVAVGVVAIIALRKR